MPATRHAADALRDPLTAAAPTGESWREEEARNIAAAIRELVGSADVTVNGATRPATWRDILVLVRRRTNLLVYEAALRRARIPYLTSRQGGLLDTLEAGDLVALLEFLTAPFTDLRLARALRSPMFSVSDAELGVLAQAGSGTWWERLRRLARAGESCPDALARAERLLSGWIAGVDRRPVHDLLDRIFFEADVLERYRHAAPAALRDQVASNLHAVLELALAVDAGRYPSLPRFIATLADMRRGADEEAPAEGVAADGADAVRILTVHGAKGLEAPIVFVIDAHFGKGVDRGDTLVEWSPGDPRPARVSLHAGSGRAGRFLEAALQAEARAAALEDANLLYVAMTRASEALVISGTPLARQTQSWHQRVHDALGSGGTARSLSEVLSRRGPAVITKGGANPARGRPLGVPVPAGRRIDAIGTVDARMGIAFHALMERTTGPDAVRYSAEERIAGIEVTKAEVAVLEAAARSLAATPALRRFFDPTQYRRATNEVPLIDPAGNMLRIDRLVEFDDAIWILDYKTTQRVVADDVVRAAALHRPQLERYREAVRPFAGTRAVRALVIFAGGAHCEL